MFVLAVDTSSAAVTAAVVELVPGAPQPVLRAARAQVAPRGHGELLTPAIGACLDECGMSPIDIGAVVAGTGPGPFTGLRVGLVTAAAFADALGVPVYGECSLDAIAQEFAGDGELLVVTDARRREVYWARYDATGRRTAGPQVARPADVPFDGVTWVAGAGLDVDPQAWPLPAWPPPGPGDLGPGGTRRLERSYPDPQSLVRLAAGRILGGAASEVLTPRYLRRPDAVVPGAPKTVTR